MMWETVAIELTPWNTNVNQSHILQRIIVQLCNAIRHSIEDDANQGGKNSGIHAIPYNKNKKLSIYEYNEIRRPHKNQLRQREHLRKQNSNVNYMQKYGV